MRSGATNVSGSTYPEDDHDDSVASDPLGNEDTMNKLAFIDDLKKLGINELVNLPQLVVVGDQSSGKSSVLKAITRLPFSIEDGLCTRFPTEVSLERASKSSLEFTITNPARADGVLERDGTQKRWFERQSSRIDAFNAEFESKNVKNDEFSESIAKASAAITGDPIDAEQSARRTKASRNQRNVLSDATLKIVRKGLEEINITVIDIPGLVSVNHAAHKVSKALVDRYIFNPRSIILAVAHPANVETQDVFQIIGKIKDWKERVIGVITKCDKIEEGGDDWVQKAIKNDESDPEFDRCLTYGWFGLRNLSPAERKLNPDPSVRDHKERELFKSKIWKDLDPSKLGIKNLKDALTKMHNEHVTRSIPELIPEIETRLHELKRKIEALGSPRDTEEKQINCLVNLATQYSIHAADAIGGHNDRLPINCPEVKLRKIFRDALESFKDRMVADYEERFNFNRPGFDLESEEETTWQRSILKNRYLAEIGRCISDNRGMEMSDEVNTAVLRSLWVQLTPKWRAQTQALITTLVQAIKKSVELLLGSTCEEDPLRENIMTWLAEDTDAVSGHANHELDLLLNDEKSGLIITLNDWNVERLQKFQDDRIHHMILILEKTRVRDRELVRNQIKLWLGKHTKIDAIFTTHDKLASYYWTGMQRFVDNVCHQICERHLMGAKSPLRTFAPDLVMKKFEGDAEGLKRIAGETGKQLAERKRLQRDHDLLMNAMNKATEYKTRSRRSQGMKFEK